MNKGLNKQLRVTLHTGLNNNNAVTSPSMFRTLTLKTRGLYLVTEVVMFNLTLIDQVYFG